MAGALQLEINSSAVSGGTFNTGASILVPALPYRPPAPVQAQPIDWQKTLSYLGIGITVLGVIKLLFFRKAG